MKLKFGKEKLKKIRNSLKYALNLWYTKYIAVCVVGILVVGFLDENSLWNHLKNMQRISELEDEIEVYEKQDQQNKARIRQLQKDPKAMEKIARERYFMKADDEDIFVLSDDENEEKTKKVKP